MRSEGTGAGCLLTFVWLVAAIGAVLATIGFAFGWMRQIMDGCVPGATSITCGPYAPLTIVSGIVALALVGSGIVAVLRDSTPK